MIQRFPHLNFCEVEKKIATYLAIAGDREGGRKERTTSTEQVADIWLTY